MRIPRYEQYAAQKELQSNSRIPNVDVSGSMAVGRALQGVGRALGGLGADLESAQAKAKLDAEKQQAFAMDQKLFEYQQIANQSDEYASVHAQQGGVGYHDAGVQYITPYAGGLDTEINRLNQQGYTELAAKISQRKMEIELGMSARLRQKEFGIASNAELDFLQKKGTSYLTAVGGLPEDNDKLRQDFHTSVDNATHLTADQKAALKELQDVETFKRELELMYQQDPNSLAKELGLPRPDAPVKQAVFDAAKASGVNAEAALAIAQLESGFNPGAVSHADAFGIFQLIPGTSARYGGGQGTGTGQQIAAGIAYIADSQRIMSEALGRDPTMGEIYLAHIIGQGGGPKIANMPDNTPIIQALAAAGHKDPNATYSGNRKVFGGVQTVGDLKQRAEQLMATSLAQAYGDGTPAKPATLVQGTGFSQQDTERLRTRITYDLQGKKRSQRPQEYIALNAQAAVESVNPNWRIVVHSGMGEHGSDRHRAQNGGRAADIYVVDENGQTVSMKNYPEAVPALFRAFAQRGFKGLGYYGDGNASIHVDDVRTANWGPSLSKDSLPANIAAAIAEGRGQSGGRAMFNSQGAANPRYAALDLGTRQQLFTSAATNQKAAWDAQAKENKTIYDSYVSAFEDKLTTQGAAFDIQEVLGDPRLKPEDREKLVDRYKKDNKDAIMDGEQAARMNAGQPLLSDDKAERESANRVFDKTVGEDWRTRPRETAGWMRQYEFVPKAVLSATQNGLETGNINDLRAGLPAFAALLRDKPAALDGIKGSKDIEAAAYRFDEFMENGYTEQAALDAIARDFHPDNRKTRKDLLSVKEDVIKKVTSVEGMTEMNAIPEAELGNPEQAGAMLADWKFIYTEAMVDAQGNDAVAEKIAKTRFGAIYGPSTIEGAPRWMRRPPERTNIPELFVGYRTDFFGNPEVVKDRSWMLKQAEADILNRYASRGQLVPGTIQFHATPITERAAIAGAKDVPYKLSWQAIDPYSGLPTVQTSEIEFIPDVASAEAAAAAAQQEQAQQRINAGRRAETPDRVQQSGGTTGFNEALNVQSFSVYPAGQERDAQARASTPQRQPRPVPAPFPADRSGQVTPNDPYYFPQTTVAPAAPQPRGIQRTPRPLPSGKAENQLWNIIKGKPVPGGPDMNSEYMKNLRKSVPSLKDKK